MTEIRSLFVDATDFIGLRMVGELGEEVGDGFEFAIDKGE